jgi:hypothetical protein
MRLMVVLVIRSYPGVRDYRGSSATIFAETHKSILPRLSRSPHPFDRHILRFRHRTAGSIGYFFLVSLPSPLCRVSALAIRTESYPVPTSQNPVFRCRLVAGASEAAMGCGCRRRWRG